MNPAVLNNMTKLIVIDGYEVWYFEASNKRTLRPYLVINTEVGNHSWVDWDASDYYCQFTRSVITFIRSHAILAHPTI